MKYAECHSVADIVREVFDLVRWDRSRSYGGRVAYYFRGENANHEGGGDDVPRYLLKPGIYRDDSLTLPRTKFTY